LCRCERNCRGWKQSFALRSRKRHRARRSAAHEQKSSTNSLRQNEKIEESRKFGYWKDGHFARPRLSGQNRFPKHGHGCHSLAWLAPETLPGRQVMPVPAPELYVSASDTLHGQSRPPRRQVLVVRRC